MEGELLVTRILEQAVIMRRERKGLVRMSGCRSHAWHRLNSQCGEGQSILQRWHRQAQGDKAVKKKQHAELTCHWNNEIASKMSNIRCRE
jgi:hypothetical protein